MNLRFTRTKRQIDKRQKDMRTKRRWIGLRKHPDDLQWTTKIEKWMMGKGGGGCAVWSRSLDLLKSMIYDLNRSVDLRWLFDHRCYIHPLMIMFVFIRTNKLKLICSISTNQFVCSISTNQFAACFNLDGAENQMAWSFLMNKWDSRFAKIQKPFSNEQLSRAGFANTKMQNSWCNVQMSYS